MLGEELILKVYDAIKKAIIIVTGHFLLSLMMNMAAVTIMNHRLQQYRLSQACPVNLVFHSTAWD